MEILSNLLSAIIGGLIVAWYQAELASRTAKGNRLRDVYYPMLAATVKAEAFGQQDERHLTSRDGAMRAAQREFERKRLLEVLDHLDNAAGSARWLEFESDSVASHLRRSLSALQVLLHSHQVIIEADGHHHEAAVDRDWARAEKKKISRVCYSLRFFLTQHIQGLERSPAKDIEVRIRRRLTRIRTFVRRQMLWWRVRLAVWKKGKRVKTIQKQLKDS